MDTDIIIKKYFSSLDDTATQRFAQLRSVYSYWNERINVISRKDLDSLYLRHVLHSLATAKIVKFDSSVSVLDIGTGGGFPAVPLAIMFPDTRFVAVDSIGKKIKVLENVCAELNLTNVEARCERAEKIAEKFDFVTGRAVTNLPDFVAVARKNVAPSRDPDSPNGIICLKGGNLDEEINHAVKKHSLRPDKIIEYKISDFFEEDFFETKKIIHIRIKG